jgi:hypothetical protein
MSSDSCGEGCSAPQPSAGLGVAMEDLDDASA